MLIAKLQRTLKIANFLKRKTTELVTALRDNQGWLEEMYHNSTAKQSTAENLNIMDKTEDMKRYKWSTSATNLLVTIWCHDLVQKQLKMSTRNQPVWESIARYMSRKGYSVTGLQCKTRIKNMLCNYNENMRKNEMTASEPYFDLFKKVLRNNRKKNKETSDSEESKSSANDNIDDSQVKKEENNIELSSNDIEVDPIVVQETKDSEYKMEFLDISSNEQASVNYVECELKKLQNVIVQAIENQTLAITNAINANSDLLEKLLTAEQDKLERRKQVEIKLDKLLEKLETNIIPHMAYMGSLIETSPE